MHKCSRRVGAPVSGRKPKHTQGGAERGRGDSKSSGGVTDKKPRDDKKTERRQKTRETLLSVGFFFM